MASSASFSTSGCPRQSGSCSVAVVLAMWPIGPQWSREEAASTCLLPHPLSHLALLRAGRPGHRFVLPVYQRCGCFPPHPRHHPDEVSDGQTSHLTESLRENGTAPLLLRCPLTLGLPDVLSWRRDSAAKRGGGPGRPGVCVVFGGGYMTSHRQTAGKRCNSSTGGPIEFGPRRRWAPERAGCGQSAARGSGRAWLASC